MHLSCLLLDVGENPDRPRPGRLWLRNLYHVHQRLCMAFPSDPRKKADPEFLAPYDPRDFPEQHHLADKSKRDIDDPDVLSQVHAPRNRDMGFLFRIDPQPSGRVVILVQSALRPDWEYAFHNAPYLLAAAPEVKPFDPSFAEGQRLRFRLVANPTKRFSKNSRENNGQPVDAKWVGKRVPVRNDQLFEWLARRAEQSGFSIEEDYTTVQPGYIYVNKYVNKTREGEGHRLSSVRYDGILNVINPDRLKETTIHGIGSGKAYGCGLLSIARASGEP